MFLKGNLKINFYVSEDSGVGLWWQMDIYNADPVKYVSVEDTMCKYGHVGPHVYFPYTLSWVLSCQAAAHGTPMGPWAPYTTTFKTIHNIGIGYRLPVSRMQQLA